MIALASCHREEVPYHELQEDNSWPISFSTIHASLDVKSGEDNGANAGTTTPVINKFMVWASRIYSGSQTPDYQIFGHNGSTVNYSDGIWVYSPVRYWQTGEYKFVAVSYMSETTNEYIGTMTSSGLNVNFTTPWNLSTTHADLILASATASGESQRNNNANVAFTFDHQLAKVKFSAKNNDSREPAITITGIKISGNSKVASAMVYNPSSKSTTWALSNTDGWAIGITPVVLETDKFKDITDYVLVFPENLQANNRALTVEITFNETLGGVSTTGNVKSATINPNWAAGYKYDYSITLTSDHLTFSEPTVTQWEDAGSVTDSEIQI